MVSSLCSCVTKARQYRPQTDLRRAAPTLDVPTARAQHTMPMPTASLTVRQWSWPPSIDSAALTDTSSTNAQTSICTAYHHFAAGFSPQSPMATLTSRRQPCSARRYLMRRRQIFLLSWRIAIFTSSQASMTSSLAASHVTKMAPCAAVRRVDGRRGTTQNACCALRFGVKALQWNLSLRSQVAGRACVALAGFADQLDVQPILK